MCPIDTFPSTSQPLPGPARAASRALCLAVVPGQASRCPTRRVGDDVGRPHAALWAVLGQAVPYHRRAVEAAHTVRVGRPRGFRSVHSFLNRNPFLFYSEFISDSNFENSYLDLQNL
jgi:hypothetical protein